MNLKKNNKYEIKNNANNFIFPLLPYRWHITNYNSYAYVDSNWNKSNK